MTRAFDVELLFQSYPDFLGENFSPEQIHKFRRETTSWLNTLPMYEYAYVLMHYTAHHLGGNNPVQYPNFLFNELLLPVVNSYLKQLTWYRFMRATEMRKYFSMRKICPKEGHVTMKTKFGLCTARTKELLRHICEDYKWIKSLEDNDPKRTQFAKIIRRICKEFDKKHDIVVSDYTAAMQEAEICQ